MANQNAVENSLATTTDSDQQGSVDDASSNAVEDSNASSQESASDAPQQYQAPSPVRSQGELVDALVPAGDADAEQKEVPNGRPYEIVVIVRTTHGNEIEGITNRAKELIETFDGAVDNVRTSDVRRFSYPINKEVEGSYVVINARFVTATVLDLDRFFKLEEGVLRHLIVREDI